MNYSAPDFEKIQIRVTTLFADYNCTEKSTITWDYTYPCPGSDNYTQVKHTYTELGSDACWVNNVG